MSRGRVWLWAGAAALLPVACLPIGDPDLWWHLSAGRWIWESLAWPRREAFSWTLAGAPWTDFEWLGQLVFHGAHRLGGLAALWALKTLLVFLAAFLADSACARAGALPRERAFSLAIWTAALLPRAEIRVELFSLCAFAFLAGRVESYRRGEAGRPLGGWAGAGLFFAAWANTHTGFLMGLLWTALGAAGEALGGARERARTLGLTAVAGAAFACANPYGPAVYSVALGHGADSAVLGSLIYEWAAPGLGAKHWGVWLCLGLWLGALAAKFRREGAFSWGDAADAVLAALALKHVRLAPYFATALLARRGFAALRPGSFAAAAAALTVLLFGLVLGARSGLFRSFSHEFYWPVGLARHLCAELPALEREARAPGDLRVYHPWGWGGYLGFHLPPPFRVFQDGRYLFHPLLEEAARAAREPRSWEAFLDGRGVTLAALENAPSFVVMDRLYPDGTRRPFARPFYARYMPKESWALIYWDEKALLFARRSAFAPGALARREYRLHRPRDEAALQDALSRGEADARVLEAERSRWARERGE